MPAVKLDAGAPTLKGNPERCGRTPIQWPAPERGQRAWLKWPLVTRLLTLVANSPDGRISASAVSKFRVLRLRGNSPPVSLLALPLFLPDDPIQRRLSGTLRR
jgi:hypothetical protein